jgi:hypothetical protein
LLRLARTLLSPADKSEICHSRQPLKVSGANVVKSGYLCWMRSNRGETVEF